MKSARLSPLVALTMITVCISGCTKSPKSEALSKAQEYARNAVGRADAPVWDEMVCTYGDKDELPEIVTGYVNGGKGAQLFLVTFDVDGKPNGDVELKPLHDTDPGVAGYWREVERDRKGRANKFCGVWKDLMGYSASIYWHAAQNGSDPIATIKQMDEVRDLALKGEH